MHGEVMGSSHMKSSSFGIGIAAAVAATLAMGGTAFAGPAPLDAYSTNFDGVSLVATSDPSSWRMTGLYDASVDQLGANTALRMSNASTRGSFGDMIFSPRLAVAATENGPARSFTASFSLLPVRLQPGLRVTVSPDNGEGGRAGFLAIEHTATAMTLTVSGSYFDKNGELQWKDQVVASNLDPTVARTVSMKLVKKANTPGNTNNDSFTITLAGNVTKTSTFEAYYQDSGEPNYATDTLLFRLSGTAVPALLGAGLYVDDVSMSTY